MKKTIKIIAMICLSSMMLVGCGNKLFDKAVEQGKLAVASKEYDKAKASFGLALEEQGDLEVEKMLVQVEKMLAGLKAKEDGNIEEATEHFRKVVDGGGVLPSLAEEAAELELELALELQEIQDRVSAYDASILEAEKMIEEKKYGESKDILNKVIKDTEGIEGFEVQNKKAQDLLGKVHSAVIEASKEAEAKKQEEEKRNREAEEEKKKTAAKKAEKTIKYYVPELGAYLTEDEMFGYYNEVGIFDYVDTNGETYMFNPGSIKADDFYN